MQSYQKSTLTNQPGISLFNPTQKTLTTTMKSVLYILLAFVFFSACSSGGSTDRKAELEQLKKQEAEIREKITKLQAEINASGNIKDVKMVEVSTTEVTVAPFRHFIDVQARVDADENVSISPETPGTILRIHVKPGDAVRKGSVLAEMDNQVYMKSLEELQSSRDFANTLYEKQKALWEQKIGTEIQFLTAKNNLQAIDNKIATVKEQIDMTRLKSPINGTVDQVDIKIGQAVAPGIPAIRVVNLGQLTVKAEVAEAYISKVKKGDEVEILFPDLNKSIRAKVSYSGKVIDPLNRAFNVEINVNEPNLHPNMVAVLRIADYKADNAVVMPVNVVQTTPEGSYVFVVDTSNNKPVARKRVIETGQNYNGQLEIKSGLAEGDMVITTGYQDLTDGQPVKI